MSNLCVIPARGGSKRILRKNIKEFCGKPIIAYSIEAALNSGCFERIIVSTDDEEIASIAELYGAEIPFYRPDELANDYIGTVPVMAHAIREMERQNFKPDYVCCLYATAPFVSEQDLQVSLLELKHKKVKFCFSVTDFAFPIQRAVTINQNGCLSMFYPQYEESRSQDLVPAWHDAGQFYWGVTDAWLKELSLFSTHSVAYKLPRYRVQDIDTLEDWLRAEWMYKAMKAVV